MELVLRWNLVVWQPRERPIFSYAWRHAGSIQRVQHRIQHGGNGPAAKLTIDGAPLAKLLGKVTPARTCPGNPEHAIQDHVHRNYTFIYACSHYRHVGRPLLLSIIQFDDNRPDNEGMRRAKLSNMTKFPPSSMRSIGGAIWMLISAASFSIQLAILKLATHSLHPFEVLLLRNCLAIAPLAAMVLFFRLQRPSDMGLFVTRAALGVAAAAALYTATSLAPLALVMLLFNARLFPMGALAYLVLDESIPRQRWLYILVGFIGITVAIAPTFAGHATVLGVLLAVAAALLSACSQITVKRLTQRNSAVAVAFYSQLLLFVMSIPLALPVWSVPRPVDLLMIGTASSFGGLAAVSAAKALQQAPATVVSPIDYASVIFSALLGYVVFAEIPTLNTVLGAIVIGIAAFMIVGAK